MAVECEACAIFYQWVIYKLHNVIEHLLPEIFINHIYSEHSHLCSIGILI